jgi:RepB DNA-primase from phage plasmid
MGAARYEVVVVNAKTSKPLTREWATSELLKSVKWLKRMNAQGSDIYIRPLDGPELMLVDGLDAETLERIRSQGLAPAAVIETAPGRLQAWVKLSDRPLPAELRKPAVLGLARVFPEVGELGRLAGFTNQLAEANKVGRHSYVLARETTGNVAPSAQPYLDAVDRLLREHAAERQRLAQVDEQRAAQVEKAMRAPHRDRGRTR